MRTLPIVLGKICKPKLLAGDLIKIKNLIAEINYNHSDSKRHKALSALLYQCDYILDKIDYISSGDEVLKKSPQLIRRYIKVRESMKE